MTITTVKRLLEALHKGETINRVMVCQSRVGGKTREIMQLCKERHIPCQLVPLDAIARKAGAAHQGIFAEVAPIKFFQLDDIITDSARGLILILDRVQDTGNLGAIIRTAVAAGVDGIVVSANQSAPINETVMKTSAGTLTQARIAQAKNLNRVVETLKEKGYWVAAADVLGAIPYYSFNFQGKTAVILGNEAEGVAALLKKNADERIMIPHSGQVQSLNVSVAAAIILFEARRQTGF